MKTQINKEIWGEVSETILQRVSEDAYKRWFVPLRFISDDGQEVVFEVPNPIHKFFLESNYLSLIRDTLTTLLGRTPQIRIATKEAQEKPPTPAKQENSGVSQRSERAASAPSVGGLNERNTFDTFVVSASNEFAHAATLAVANSLTRSNYNPLFIYGHSGLGKTHLLHAIGHHVLATHKNARVVYLTSEQFTNEFIDALANDTMSKFRKRYRQADILLIDDIQFLSGREKTQEEFFHTFNALHDGHKQIVLSSDRPASEVSNLEQRLVSRFVWGMTAEIQPPDLETRIAILRKKAGALDISLPAWVFEFLADRIRSNIRQLEGTLTRIASYSSLSKREITREMIESLCRDIFQEQVRRAVTIDNIQRKVAEHFDIRVADMTSKRRPANIAFPRQVAMFLARERTSSSLMDIGEAFGGRDHGTIIHAVKLVKARMAKDEKVRMVVKMLDNQLQR